MLGQKRVKPDIFTLTEQPVLTSPCLIPPGLRADYPLARRLLAQRSSEYSNCNIDPESRLRRYFSKNQEGIFVSLSVVIGVEQNCGSSYC
jgi:hypothetical protein